LALWRSRGFRQFVKFCIVGASSTAVDVGVLIVLLNVFSRLFSAGPLSASEPEWQGRISIAISFLCGVTNGFFWNRRWTFRAQDGGPARQYVKFCLVNLVGLGLNLGIVSLLFGVIPRALVAATPAFIANPRTVIAKLAAITVVVFWNFLASKYWTFAD